VAPDWCLENPGLQTYPGGIPAPGTRQGVISSFRIYFSGYPHSCGRKDGDYEIEAVNPDQLQLALGKLRMTDCGIAEYLGVGPSMANRREYLIFLAASSWFLWEFSPVGVHLSVACETLLCDHF